MQVNRLTDPEDTSVGYGGLPNENGIVQLDASIMDGKTYNAGAVACLENIKNPSSDKFSYNIFNDCYCSGFYYGKETAQSWGRTDTDAKTCYIKIELFKCNCSQHIYKRG